MKGIAAPHPLRRQGLPVAGLAAVAPRLAAREGGSDAGSPGVAQVASSSASALSSASSSVSQDPLAFSGCMRAHGVTNFHGGPTHGVPGGRGGVDLRGLGIELDSPRFTAAQQALPALPGPQRQGRLNSDGTVAPGREAE